MKRTILSYFKSERNADNISTNSEIVSSKKKKHTVVPETDIIEISSDEDDHWHEIGEKNVDTSANKPCLSSEVTMKETKSFSSTSEPQQATSLEEFKSVNSKAITDESDLPYYLKDFFLILNSVLLNNNDKRLFEGDDMLWIEKFKRMSTSSQMLYIRLYQRKSAWLPVEKISYPLISKRIEGVLNNLVENFFLLESSQEDFSLPEVLHILSAPLVRELSKTHHIQKGTKEQNISALMSLCKKQKILPLSTQSLEATILKRALKYLGKCYKVAPYPKKVFNRLLLVFDVTKGTSDDSECSITGSSQPPFYGKHQQLSSILLAGMGKVVYPTYTIHTTTPIFQNRDELLEYETAYQLKLDVLSACDSSQWKQALELCKKAIESSNSVAPSSKKHALSLKPFLRIFSASSVYIQILSIQVEILQRLKNYKEATEILLKLLDQNNFCLLRRGFWAERLALNLDQHLHNKEMALKVVLQSLSDKFVRVGHKLSLNERCNKLRSRPSQKGEINSENSFTILQAEEISIVGRILPKRLQTGKARFMWQNSDDPNDVLLCSVEEYALAYYKSLNYSHGLHGEGGTLSCLFCLLFWDIIFMEGVPDVFRTQFQSHPLDMFTDEFYIHRKNAVETRLRDIANWQTSTFSVSKQITDTWNLQENISCSGMNWQLFSSLNQVLSLVECIGGATLNQILAILVKDLRHTRSGLPDLVVWTPKTNHYKFVEVKGPGDRLQNNQKMWMHKLVSMGANVEVCYVSASASRKLKI